MINKISSLFLAFALLCSCENSHTNPNTVQTIPSGQTTVVVAPSQQDSGPSPWFWMWALDRGSSTTHHTETHHYHETPSSPVVSRPLVSQPSQDHGISRPSLPSPSRSFSTPSKPSFSSSGSRPSFGSSSGSRSFGSGSRPSFGGGRRR